MNPPEAPLAGAAPCGWLEERDGIAWLWLDQAGQPVNTLSSRLFEWMEAVLTQLEARSPMHGLVVVSGKPASFIAGADLQELRSLPDAAAVRRWVERGHALVGRLAVLPFPTVAAIHGSCLGGGLELALACRWRVATDVATTQLGLPEVQLGLIPGLGGTQRLPRLVGVTEALPLLLTGRRLTAPEAMEIGLVDAVCQPAELLRVASCQLFESRGRSAGELAKATRNPTDLAARMPGARKLIFDRARREADAATSGHYPAARVAIEVVENGLSLPLAEALVLEADAFARLAVSPTARALIEIFFTKNRAEARAAHLAAASGLGPRGLTRVGVLGAGFMGAGVSQVLSERGVPVVLKDRDADAVAHGMERCAGRFDTLVDRGRLRPVEATEAMARIHGAVDYPPLARCELVIEAVFEELAVKQRVLRELEAVAREDQIFASNTSAIPIASIAAASRRPENVVGMHFFSPVHKMPLVEVITHPGSSRRAQATAVAAARRMGKTALVVGDGPGFFTTRVLAPFLNEAAWCLAQGATIEAVDGALTRWGWPVGPLALLDEVGLDVATHAAGVLQAALGERFAPPPILAMLLEDGRSGRKMGKGFYSYGKTPGKARHDKTSKEPDRRVYKRIGWKEAPVAEQEIVERCWMQMLNEAARTIEDGVITHPDDVDLAVILGFGFPPFRGGLLREADRLGAGYVVERLDTLAEVYGERLRPAALLRTMAERGETFHRDGGRRT